MPSVNESLQDASVRHQVFVLRYGQHLANNAISLINQAEEQILGKIAFRLERISSRGRDSGPATTRRLRRLLQELRELNQGLYSTVNSNTTEELVSFASREVDLQQRRLFEAIGANLGSLVPSNEQLSAVVRSRPFQGRLLADWFNGLNNSHQQRLDNVIRQGILQSQTNDEIIRQIRGTRSANFTDGIMQISRRHAATTVRTATQFVSNEAKEEFFRLNDDVIRVLEWTSTLDSRTSPICQARDGKIAPNGDTTEQEARFYGELISPIGARPPAHHNCRSTMSPITISWDDLLNTRPNRNREGSGGFRSRFEESLRRQGFTDQQIANIEARTRASMNGQVPDDVDYEAWLRRQPTEFQNDVLGRTRGRLFREGNLSLDRFVDNNSGDRFTLEELERRENSTWMSVFNNT